MENYSAMKELHSEAKIGGTDPSEKQIAPDWTKPFYGGREAPLDGHILRLVAHDARPAASRAARAS